MALTSFNPGMPRLSQMVYLAADVRIGTLAGALDYSKFDATVTPVEKKVMWNVQVALSTDLLERSHIPKEVIVKEVTARMVSELRQAVETQVSALFDTIYEYAEKKPVPTYRPLPPAPTTAQYSGTAPVRADDDRHPEGDYNAFAED